jgi:hypothetical protein
VAIEAGRPEFLVLNRIDKPAVIFDVDGVLLDWFGSFKQWMRGQGIKIDDDAQVQWNMTETFVGLSEAEIDAKVAEFNNSEHFGHLDHWPGALAAIMQLRRSFSGALFAALTGSGITPKTTRLRASSVEQFPIDEMFILPLGDSKIPWLKRYDREGSVFIEDNAKHALAAVGLIEHVILLDREYNRVDTPGVTRCMSWDDAVEHITQVLS